MNKFNPHKHYRRSIRLAGYDYGQAGLYFVTICCQDRAHLFGSVIDGVMQLNTVGQIASQEWLHTEEIRDNVVLHEYVIMPNHVHGIIEIRYPKDSSNKIGKFTSPSQTIGAIVRGYKIATIKRIKDMLSKGESKGESKGGWGELQFTLTFAPTAPIKIWQRNYYEHIIRDERAYINISTYIKNNPRQWAVDQDNNQSNTPKTK